MLRFLTAGESHGPGLTVVVEGLPAGVPVRPRERSTPTSAGVKGATVAADG